MSTRCQIAFYESKPTKAYDFTALLYRHGDGYPGSLRKDDVGILPDIVPTLRLCYRFLGHRPEYMAAQVVWKMSEIHRESMRDVHLVALKHKEVPPRELLLGLGVCHEFHYDIDYLYCCRPGYLDCYAVGTKPVDHATRFRDLKKICTVGLAPRGTKRK